MLRKSLVVLAILSLSGTAYAASQDGGGHRGGKGFERMDLNADGRLSEQEMLSVRLERFDRIDANGDGAVTRQEFEAGANARRADRVDRMWSQLDSDGDGRTLREETEARVGERFARMDIDGDGAVTLEEIREMRKARKNRQ